MHRRCVGRRKKEQLCGSSHTNLGNNGHTYCCCPCCIPFDIKMCCWITIVTMGYGLFIFLATYILSQNPSVNAAATVVKFLPVASEVSGQVTPEAGSPSVTPSLPASTAVTSDTPTLSSASTPPASPTTAAAPAADSKGKAAAAAKAEAASKAAGAGGAAGAAAGAAAGGAAAAEGGGAAAAGTKAAAGAKAGAGAGGAAGAAAGAAAAKAAAGGARAGAAANAGGGAGAGDWNGLNMTLLSDPSSFLQNISSCNIQKATASSANKSDGILSQFSAKVRSLVEKGHEGSFKHNNFLQRAIKNDTVEDNFRTSFTAFDSAMTLLGLLNKEMACDADWPDELQQKQQPQQKQPNPKQAPGGQDYQSAAPGVPDKTSKVSKVNPLTKANNTQDKDVTQAKTKDPIKDTVLSKRCPKTPKCKPLAKFRAIDGSCNNLEQPKYGQTATVLSRVLGNKYQDGLSIPRGGFKEEIPSARKVSNTLFTNKSDHSPDITVLVMTFGQFVDHDLTHVPVFDNKGEPIDCCTADGKFIQPLNSTQFMCFPIRITADDQYFKGKECMNFVRSVTGPRVDCLPGPAEQLNQVTHWLDGSAIYGSDKELENELRDSKDGLLLISQAGNATNLLPLRRKNDTLCNDKALCFKAGDTRVNENPNLTVMHTIWVRYHNFLAKGLKKQNPKWSHERLYQESRRLLIAVLQHITYAEYLPMTLGTKLMSTKGLTVQTAKGQKANNDYNAKIDPRVTNEFMSAAFRYGHSLIPNKFELWDHRGNKTLSTLKVSRWFFRPHTLAGKHGVDQIAKGMTAQKAEKVDIHFTEDVSRELFSITNGLDLLALNLQRGRDHGLQPYISYLSHCSKKARVKSFKELEPHFGPKYLATVKSLYSKVEDIDLYVGLFAETFKISAGIVPPTIACILADQFSKLKQGDRFFYDLKDRPGSFNQAQLDAIRSIRISRVICDTTEIEQMQPKAFYQTEPKKNAMCNCSDSRSIPKLDFSVFVIP